MPTKVYKIVVSYSGLLKTLFHGINGSRILKKNIWLKADEKYVSDGSGGKTYKSGFHVFLTKQTAKTYFKKFKNKTNRIIIECLAENLRIKPTNPSVYLAEKLFIL